MGGGAVVPGLAGVEGLNMNMVTRLTLSCSVFQIVPTMGVKRTVRGMTADGLGMKVLATQTPIFPQFPFHFPFDSPLLG